MKINVYTSGVFDLFHAGHIEALEKAKALGTSLIVGVLSDEDAASYKRIPIIPYDQRSRIVKNLSLVDRVALAPKYEATEFYYSMKIDIHCQGDQIEGFYEVARQLGILRIVGRSMLNESSRIMNIIKRQDDNV